MVLGLRWVGIICCFVGDFVFGLVGGIWLRYFWLVVRFACGCVLITGTLFDGLVERFGVGCRSWCWALLLVGLCNSRICGVDLCNM